MAEVTRKALVGVLKNTADLLDLLHQEAFRAQAYRSAARSLEATETEVVQKAKPTRGTTLPRPYSQEQTACPDCAKTMTRKSLPKHRRETCRAQKVTA